MSHPLYDDTIGHRRLRVVATTRDDGSFHPERVPADVLDERQASITGTTWSLVTQVHGVEVAEAPAGLDRVADVVVTDAVGCPVAIWAADCAPLVLASHDGTLVAAHAGWRGLAAGVVDVAVATARRHGGDVAVAVLGPVIGPCCYEFSREEFSLVRSGVAGTTVDGRFALDVPTTVAASLAAHGITLDVSGPCTGCTSRWFSHRVRGDVGRHGVVAWWDQCEDVSR